jgi:predicted metal-binding protein
MRPIDLAFGGGARKTRLVIRPKIRKLCARPYPNHRKGCPNFNDREGCPPNTKLISSILDLSKPVWLIWNAFAFGAHVYEMKKKHPDWSQRQLECCLYWQGKARKHLKDRVRRFLLEQGEDAIHLTVLYTPEAHGVNVTATMAKHGLTLQWPPKDYACQVAIAGFRRRGTRR